ncbi:MAG: AbrB/MazE/SpoVT family DNA-binding domain-containing protein [Nitrososphaerales archaeon]|nr:AbrB/MazE/SpoVT family DNA-binding domain-containing protein [Nitrososphaerales archaeon]
MTKALTKARRVGGSIMVRIPKELVEQEEIREGELLEVDVRKVRKSWFGAFPGAGPFTHEDELDVHE